MATVQGWDNPRSTIVEPYGFERVWSGSPPDPWNEPLALYPSDSVRELTNRGPIPIQSDIWASIGIRP